MQIIEIILLTAYLSSAALSLFGVWLGYYLAANSESYDNGQKWMNFADACMSIFASLAFLGLFFIVCQIFLH